MTTDEQRSSFETQVNKENIVKLEKQVSDLRIETVQLTSKYLEGFNKILEAQGESRTCDRQLSQDFMSLKEKLILLESAIEKLQNIDAYSEIKRFIEHIKNEKDVVEYKVESFWIPVRGEQSQFTILIHYVDGEMISCPTKR